MPHERALPRLSLCGGCGLDFDSTLGSRTRVHNFGSPTTYPGTFRNLKVVGSVPVYEALGVGPCEPAQIEEFLFSDMTHSTVGQSMNRVGNHQHEVRRKGQIENDSSNE